MTSSLFFEKKGRLCGFCISGHSGYASSGSDIVCAAVSAMTSLVITLFDRENVDYTLKTDEKNAEVNFEITFPTGFSDTVLNSFLDEMKSMANEYGKYLSVETKIK